MVCVCFIHVIPTDSAYTNAKRVRTYTKAT